MSRNNLAGVVWNIAWKTGTSRNQDHIVSELEVKRNTRFGSKLKIPQKGGLWSASGWVGVKCNRNSVYNSPTLTYKYHGKRGLFIILYSLRQGTVMVYALAKRTIASRDHSYSVTVAFNPPTDLVGVCVFLAVKIMLGAIYSQFDCYRWWPLSEDVLFIYRRWDCQRRVLSYSAVHNSSWLYFRLLLSSEITVRQR